MWDQSLDVSDSQERISYLKQIRKNKKTASACGLPVTRVQAPLQRSWLPLLWLWFMRVCVCTLSHSVVSDSWWPHGLQSARLLCPRDSPGKSTGVGCHFQFPDQGLNLRLLHCMWILLLLSHLEAPYDCSLLTTKCWDGTHVLSGKGRKPSQRVHVQWALVLTPVPGLVLDQGGKSLVTAAVCTCVQGCVYRGVGELPTTQLPLWIGSDFISICQRDICTFFCPVISNVHQFSPNPLLRLTTPTSRHPLGVRAEDTQ